MTPTNQPNYYEDDENRSSVSDHDTGWCGYDGNRSSFSGSKTDGYEDDEKRWVVSSRTFFTEAEFLTMCLQKVKRLPHALVQKWGRLF